MSHHRPRGFRVVTRIVGDFEGFWPGSLLVLEHEADRVWRQVGHEVEGGIYLVDPPCIVYHDPSRCIEGDQLVICVAEIGDTTIERVRSRPITW